MVAPVTPTHCMEHSWLNFQDAYLSGMKMTAKCFSQQNMVYEDRCWIGQQLFAKKGTLVAKLKNWWHPPPSPDMSSPGTPSPLAYFLRKRFLWMPKKMWQVDFKYLRCKDPQRSLRSNGLYNRVRLVLNTKDYYYLSAEYMDCNACNGTYIAWDSRMLEQLTDGVRARFPVILTYKYACDFALISLLRARTLGNSPTALQNNIQELHSEEWLRRSLNTPH